MPRKRGGRSQYARQRKYVSRLVSKAAHRDYRKSESINVLTPTDIYDALTEKFDLPLFTVIRSYDRGEVISDGRGEGSHDRLPKQEKQTWESQLQT